MIKKIKIENKCEKNWNKSSDALVEETTTMHLGLSSYSYYNFLKTNCSVLQWEWIFVSLFVLSLVKFNAWVINRIQKREMNKSEKHNIWENSKYFVT